MLGRKNKLINKLINTDTISLCCGNGITNLPGNHRTTRCLEISHDSRLGLAKMSLKVFVAQCILSVSCLLGPFSLSRQWQKHKRVRLTTEIHFSSLVLSHLIAFCWLKRKKNAHGLWAGNWLRREKQTKFISRYNPYIHGWRSGMDSSHQDGF